MHFCILPGICFFKPVTQIRTIPLYESGGRLKGKYMKSQDVIAQDMHQGAAAPISEIDAVDQFGILRRTKIVG